MLQTDNLVKQGGGFIDSFLPHPYETWQKFLQFKQKNPYATPEQLVEKLIQQTAIITGVVGAVTSLGGFTTLIFLLPADIFICTRMEAELVYMIAYAHGLSPDDEDLKMFVYWILSGETAKAMGRVTAQFAAEQLAIHKATDMATAAAKEIGKEVGKEVGKSAYGKVNKLFNKMGSKTGRQAAQKMTRQAARKGLTKVLTKAVPRLLAKILPIAGLVIGFGVNFLSSRSMGGAAQAWFQNLPQFYDEIDNVLDEKPKPVSKPKTTIAVTDDDDLFLDEPVVIRSTPVKADDWFLDEPVAAKNSDVNLSDEVATSHAAPSENSVDADIESPSAENTEIEEVVTEAQAVTSTAIEKTDIVSADEAELTDDDLFKDTVKQELTDDDLFHDDDEKELTDDDLF